MKKISGCLAVICAAGMSVQAQNPAVAPTHAPAAPTGTVTEAAASLPPSEWTGYVRVLRGEQGEVRAVRLVANDKLIAVELNEKGIEMGKTPKTRKLLVKGEQVTRDNRPWLVVSDFQEAPDAAVAVPVTPPASPAEASTNAPPVESNTNAAPVAAATNATPAAPAP